MLSRIDFKKELKKQLLIGLTVSLLVFSAAIFLFWKINVLAREIFSLRKEVSKNQQLFANFSSLKIQKKQVLLLQQGFLNILPTKDGVLAVAGSIESLTNNLNLKQSFTFGSEYQDQDSGVSGIGFSLTLNGGLDSFSEFLKRLEALPQFIEFGSIEINRAGQDYQINSSGRIYKK